MNQASARFAALAAVLGAFLFPAELLSKSDPKPKLNPGAEALQDLKDSNAKFARGKLSSRRKELVNGQKPKAIVLSCSDSRVPPEHVFEKGLGELFTVRVAGNILGAASVASIEYAAEHLGAGLLVVMGHESCGAVKAALHSEREETTGSYDLDSLVSIIRGNLDRASDKPNRAIASITGNSTLKNLRKPVIENVDIVASDLLKRSKIIRHLVEAGKLKIIRAIYSLDTGKVDFWEN
jgi:carbonic anhydrase